MKVSCPAGVPWVSRDQKSQKRITRWLYYVICKQRKYQILGIERECVQYWKDDGLFELQKQHLAYQVRSILKTGKLSKVEIERLKRQIKQLHVDSVECETGKLDRPDEKVVTQSDDNVLLQEFTAGASGCVEDTHVSESASDVKKRLKLLLKNPKNDPISSLRSANAF